jgi:hypothetical protein
MTYGEETQTPYGGENSDALSDLENSKIGTKTMTETRPIVASTSDYQSERPLT